MELSEALDLGRNAFFMAMATSAPILLIGMAVGLSVSVFQSVTQLQEQTLTFVPKLFVVGVVLLVLIPWIMTVLIEFSGEIFQMMGQAPRVGG